MTDEQVILASDTGKKRQWALGPLFYRREGKKDRLDTRLVSWLILALFGVVMVVGLLKDPAEVVSTESPIPSPLEGKDEVKKVDVTKLQHLEKSPDEAPRPVSSPRSELARPQLGGLEKVSRQTEVKIPPGSLVEAALASGASDGPVRAVLTEDLYVNGEALIKQGTILLGQGASSEERLMVHFTHLVFKDGTHVRIEAQACDLSDKMPGLVGSNVRGRALKLTGALGLGFMGGTAIGLQKKQNGAPGATSDPSMRDALLNGVGTAALEQAQSETSDLKNIRPLFEVAEGQKFYALFNGDD